MFSFQSTWKHDALVSCRVENIAWHRNAKGSDTIRRRRQQRDWGVVTLLSSWIPKPRHEQSSHDDTRQRVSVVKRSEKWSSSLFLSEEVKKSRARAYPFVPFFVPCRAYWNQVSRGCFPALFHYGNYCFEGKRNIRSVAPCRYIETADTHFLVYVRARTPACAEYKRAHRHASAAQVHASQGDATRTISKITVDVS